MSSWPKNSLNQMMVSTRQSHPQESAKRLVCHVSDKAVGQGTMGCRSLHHQIGSTMSLLYHPPPPCISYANVRNYYGPYALCSLDKGVACAKHIQLPTQTCARAWYGCTLTCAHISKCMQTQDSLGNMKISGSHPCWHKQ